MERGTGIVDSFNNVGIQGMLVETMTDETELLSVPEIRIETEEGIERFDDALDVHIGIEDGEVSADGNVWRRISAFDVSSLLKQEIPTYRDRIEQIREDHRYAADASREVLGSMDLSGIPSTGTYLFECEKCSCEQYESASELKARMDRHRIEDKYYHDDDGEIQAFEGHEMTLWKEIGFEDIPDLADSVRDETNVVGPTGWAMNDMKIEYYGAETPAPEIHDLISKGLTPSEAVDYQMTEKGKWSQSDWATERDRTQQTISDNVRKAEEKLGE